MVADAPAQTEGANVVQHVPRRRKQKRVGLSRLKEERLKEKLRKTAPSEPWVEAQIISIDDTDDRGTPITVRFHQPRVFPPKADQTPMVECPECHRMTPAQTFEQSWPKRKRGRKAEPMPAPVCADCRPEREQDIHPPSPSAVAIAQLQYRNLRLETIKLEPESKAALRREIKRWGKYKPR